MYFLAYFPSFQHSRCQVWEGKAYCLTKYYIHFIYLNYIEGNTTKIRDYQIEYIATNWIKKKLHNYGLEFWGMVDILIEMSTVYDRKATVSCECLVKIWKWNHCTNLDKNIKISDISADGSR